MKIRKANKKNLKEIANLMLKEFSKPPFNEKENFDSVIKSLKFYFDIGKIYIAKISTEIVGVIVFKMETYWEGEVLIIEDLAVKDNFKKQGIGKKLMDFVENYSKKNNIKRILFVTDKRSKSLGFYKKLRYKEEKNRINMTKELK